MWLQVSFPIGIWALLWSKYGALVESDINHTYGSSYFQIRTNSKAALLYNVLFMLRRLVYAATAVFLAKYPPLQALILILQSLIHILYVVSVRPFEEMSLNLMELFNEATVLLATYHAMALTEMLPTDSASEIIDSQYKVGWSLITLVGINMIANLVVMIYQTALQAKQHIRNLLRKLKQWRSKESGRQTVKL